MKISRQDVLYVAELAHLELSEAEVETFRSQLDRILTYIEKLNQLDTSQVEPMAQVLSGDPGAPGQDDALRADAVRPCNVTEAALAAAPDLNKPYFRVPKVIER
jgi:aspartyl-tRNA(Asn)/glutamyl-tRNA(Gln) amidotransferase subunit C